MRFDRVAKHGGTASGFPRQGWKSKPVLPTRTRQIAAEAARLKLKGLKARKIIAQGKASPRATPWVNRSQNSLALKGAAEFLETAWKINVVHRCAFFYLIGLICCEYRLHNVEQHYEYYANCKAESGTQKVVRPVFPSENLKRCGQAEACSIRDRDRKS